METRMVKPTMLLGMAFWSLPSAGVASAGNPMPETSLSLVSIALAIVFPTVFFVLYWNRKLWRRVGDQQKLTAESEARLQLIFEHFPDAVLVVRQNGDIASANTQACACFGLTKKQILATSLVELVPVECRDEMRRRIEDCFSGKLREFEGSVKAIGGRVFPAELIGRLFQMEDQQVLQLHVRDITLRKEAEERIHAAREMAEDSKNLALRAYQVSEDASRAKSEFLASMSHEIRTPLNDIVGMAELIGGSNLTREQKNGVETIQQSSIGLLKIVNHVLDIAKMESGQMEVREEVLDLWDLCKKLQARFQPDADAKGLRFICRCQNTVPLYLVGDESLVEQVLEELLGNALKFTHKGSVMLNIECHSKTPSGTGIYFQVIDTGTGISHVQQTTLFEKRIRTAPAGNRLFSGLGLAICKQQVELMGGVLGVVSSVGRGADFHFTLSLPQAIDPVAIKALESNRSKTILRKDTRVLLVEDNKVNQKVGVAILKKIGCQVDAVDNGKYAVQQIRKENYDVVLMDCEMPILDGFETTAQIRAMGEPGCSVPIIAITANAMKDDEQRCIAAGMDDYISKPVSREVLVKLINKHTMHG